MALVGPKAIAQLDDRTLGPLDGLHEVPILVEQHAGDRPSLVGEPARLEQLSQIVAGKQRHGGADVGEVMEDGDAWNLARSQYMRRGPTTLAAARQSSSSTRTVSSSVPIARTVAPLSLDMWRWRARMSSPASTLAVPLCQRRPILIRTRGFASMLRT